MKMKRRMKSFTETIYLHREKSENWETEDKAKELGFDTQRIPYIGYEIEVELEIFADGTNKVLSINGVPINENLSI